MYLLFLFQESISVHFPMLLLGVIGVGGGLVVLLLPDTSGLSTDLN